MVGYLFLRVLPRPSREIFLRAPPRPRREVSSTAAPCVRPFYRVPLRPLREVSSITFRRELRVRFFHRVLRAITCQCRIR